MDAILLDELEGTVISLFYGGSFGEPDMTLFRQYLAERYSAQELRARFGIADIATFNYGQYIRDRGLVDLWRTDRWNLPLWSDFYEFQRSANRRFAQRLIESIRQYARQTYKREIAITANLFGLYGELLEFAPFLDYYTVEYPLLEHGYPPVDRTIVDYKLARGLGDRPAFVLLSVATIADLNRRPPVPNLMNLLVAESYAARGAFMTPYKTYGKSWSVSAEIVGSAPGLFAANGTGAGATLRRPHSPSLFPPNGLPQAQSADWCAHVLLAPRPRSENG